MGVEIRRPVFQLLYQILLIAPIICIANHLCSGSRAIIGDIEKVTNIIK